MTATRRPISSVLALVALLAVAAAVLVAISAGPSPYRLRLRFIDAGQLVPGDLVEVGGLPVGTVTGLSLTRNDVAEVAVAINPGRFTPLHVGTTAGIGTVGLSGVTNRFVALSPGPRSAPMLPDGGIVPETATTPIVDIDELLDTFTPAVRARLRGTIQGSAQVLHGNVAAARVTLAAATAAIERTGAFAGELTADRTAFSGLLGSGARTASALGDRSRDITAGIDETATALSAIARARAALADGLARSPAVLRQGGTLLAGLRPVLARLDPVLTDAQPVAAPLATLLRRLVPTTVQAAPVLAGLDHVLPRVVAALDRLPTLRAAALPALAATQTALTRALPIFTGLRPYGQDILLGFLHGYGGGSSENYDANGQFSRIALGLPGPSLLTAILGTDIHQISPHFLTGQTNKCPGSAAEPAPDGSNRIVADGCDPAQVP